MARPRTDVGTVGQFTYIIGQNGKVKARVRFRDDEGNSDSSKQPATPALLPRGR